MGGLITIPAAVSTAAYYGASAAALGGAKALGYYAVRKITDGLEGGELDIDEETLAQS